MNPAEPDAAAHWDDAYAAGEATRSWYQQHPAMSLKMLDAAGVSSHDSVIDIGGGAAPLAAHCSAGDSATSRCSTSLRRE